MTRDEQRLEALPTLPASLPQAERVVLRWVTPEDAESLTGLWLDERVRRFLGGPVHAHEAARRSRSHVARPGAFAVALTAEAEAVGLVTLDEHVSGAFEISYMFWPDAWGHAYAREAVGAVLGWAFLDVGLSRVIAITQSANRPSLSLLAAVGMTPQREFVEHGERQTLLSRVSGATPGAC